MKTKLSPKFWCALTLFSLMGQVAWVVENMYFNVFIYNMFHASAQDISAMVAASAVSATLTTVFMGALSDRIGKRKLFITAGYILWGISILAFTLMRVDIIESLFPMTVSAASLGVSLVIVLDCIMTFFGSTANDAAFNAWVTDCTDHTNRGAVEGINAMMPLLAILVVFGGFMAFDLSKSESWTMIFAIIGVTTLVIGLLGIFLIKDPKIKPNKENYFKNIFYGFKPFTIKQNPKLYVTLIAFSIFNISIQIFMPYLILYYEVSLEMSNYVLIMAPAIILAAIVTAFWGKVYDKKGFTLSIAASLLWISLGYLLLYFFRDTAMVFIGSLLIMCGYLSSMAVFGALIRDYTPVGKAGLFQGLRIFSQVLIPGVIGPSIGAAVLSGARQIVNNDGTTSFVPNETIFLAALLVIVVLIPVILPLCKKKSAPTCQLDTPWSDTGNIPWEHEYPRPQMKRDNWLNLNGTWKLTDISNKKELGNIKVPFPPESSLSGLDQGTSLGTHLCYERKFILPNVDQSQTVLLHIGAIDQIGKVYVNEILCGETDTPYLPLTCNVTTAIRQGTNHIKVETIDRLDTDYPYGKQTKKRGGMWYTPISGIWQTVWLECVPENHIESIRITPDLTGIDLTTLGGEEKKTLILKTKGAETKYEFVGDTFRLDINDAHLWSPDDPFLYEFTLISGEDRIESYFGLRTISIENRKILLNGKPYFFHGLLDQGYFSDGIFLPGRPEGFEYDILTMKSLGFNTLRKHIKIEPECFYYCCDKHGMIVFQDLVNSGTYNFLIDTALPTIGVRKGISHRASKKRREIFSAVAKGTLAHLYNHPSICYYTLFNEGWGQFDADALYCEMKQMDPTRVWDATSGWFEENESDVQSEHIYFKPIKCGTKGERPLILSEFGGYSCKIDGHSFNPKNTYGYRFFTAQEDFRKALNKLYADEIIPAIDNGLCGAILTQVSDVEDETNGLLTYDRKVLKVSQPDMIDIANTIDNTFNSI